MVLELLVQRKGSQRSLDEPDSSPLFAGLWEHLEGLEHSLYTELVLKHWNNVTFNTDILVQTTWKQTYRTHKRLHTNSGNSGTLRGSWIPN
jgi:hypothetical protein